VLASERFWQKARGAFPPSSSHLAEWAGVQRQELEALKPILVNRRPIWLYRLNLWIYRNRTGSPELLPRPHLLSLPGGVAVHPEADPRLPLIGTRVLIQNGLRCTVHGKDCCVSLAQEVT
jgi:hypothetical protein